MTELWVNRLLPQGQQNKVKHTFNYKVSTDDFSHLEKDIETFVNTVKHLI
ncbi:MAG: hypothetical protein ACOX7H_03435 [Bacillota bacterium]